MLVRVSRRMLSLTPSRSTLSPTGKFSSTSARPRLAACKDCQERTRSGGGERIAVCPFFWNPLCETDTYSAICPTFHYRHLFRVISLPLPSIFSLSLCLPFPITSHLRPTLSLMPSHSPFRHIFSFSFPYSLRPSHTLSTFTLFLTLGVVHFPSLLLHALVPISPCPRLSTCPRSARSTCPLPTLWSPLPPSHFPRHCLSLLTLSPLAFVVTSLPWCRLLVLYSLCTRLLPPYCSLDHRCGYSTFISRLSSPRVPEATLTAWPSPARLLSAFAPLPSSPFLSPPFSFSSSPSRPPRRPSDFFVSLLFPFPFPPSQSPILALAYERQSAPFPILSSSLPPSSRPIRLPTPGAAVWQLLSPIFHHRLETAKRHAESQGLLQVLNLTTS